MTVRSQIPRIFAAGRHQFPADQPHPAAAGDAVHRLVQQDRAAADPRAFDRDLAAVLRPRSQRGQEDANSGACMSASSANSRTARGRSIAIRRHAGQPVRRHRRRLRRDRRDASSIRPRDFPTRCRICSAIAELVAAHRDGRYVTLRLTSSMYHRFHAPHDCRVEQVTYISGDTWNVNPIALKRIERLFCKNERAVHPDDACGDGQSVTLVAVAAILVASIRLHCLDDAVGQAAIADETSSPATATFARARSWAGSSTVRRSSCSRRMDSRFAKTSVRAPRSAWASR